MVQLALLGGPSSLSASVASVSGSGEGENGDVSASMSEQDNTVTSSSPDTTVIGDVNGDEGSALSLSDVNEEMKSAIDLLEQNMQVEESAKESEGASQNGPDKASPHSVEYWSVSQQGKPKSLLRRYPANRHSRRQSFKPANNGLLGAATQHQSNFASEMSSQLFASNFASVPLPLPASQFQPFGQPHFMQAPAHSPLHYPVYPPAPGLPVLPQPPLPSIQIFIPPSQEQKMAAATSQFMPFPAVSQLPQSSLYPFSQQQSYVPYFGTPYQQSAFPLPLPSPTPPVSYFQGAPLYYQVPSLPLTAVKSFPASQPFLNDCSYLGGYERPMEYPPPTYEDAILTSTSPATEAIPEQTSSEMEVDTNTNKCEEPWKFQSCYFTPTISPAATPSSSDTNLSQTASDEVTDTATSGYSSCASSPLAIVPSSPETAVPERCNGANNESIADVDVSSADEESVFPVGESGEQAASVEERAVYEIGSTGSRTGLERYAMELHALNNACIHTMMMQDTIHNTLNGLNQYQQNLIVYPGETSILIYSQNDGSRCVMMYDEQEIPYVANIFDFRVQTSFKEQCGPALTYPYYVPPRTADNDFFGGQLPIWQLKMGQYFMKYQPDNWKMHGVPDTFEVETFLGRLMDSVGEFHIVSKLRFSCRTCKTPWTSKKGTIVFKFCFNAAFKQGWILMRIFGQICMRQECSDWTFQNPACYPEEIDRAMKKLSEYIGNQCYGVSVNPTSFDECFKSIRRSGNVGNNNSRNKERERANLPSTPHKKEFCQACMNGVCKNLFAKPFVTPLKRIQQS